VEKEVDIQDMGNGLISFHIHNLCQVVPSMEKFRMSEESVKEFAGKKYKVRET